MSRRNGIAVPACICASIFVCLLAYSFRITVHQSFGGVAVLLRIDPECTITLLLLNRPFRNLAPDERRYALESRPVFLSKNVRGMSLFLPLACLLVTCTLSVRGNPIAFLRECFCADRKRITSCTAVIILMVLLTIMWIVSYSPFFSRNAYYLSRSDRSSWRIETSLGSIRLRTFEVKPCVELPHTDRVGLLGMSYQREVRMFWNLRGLLSPKERAIERVIGVRFWLPFLFVSCILGVKCVYGAIVRARSRIGARCFECGYPQWNIDSRRCPECGRHR